MEVRNQDTVNEIGEIKGLVLASIEVVEVWKLGLLDHVNSTVEHDGPATYFSNYTGTADVLTGS
jgi:hypothetical protein